MIGTAGSVEIPVLATTGGPAFNFLGAGAGTGADDDDDEEELPEEAEEEDSVIADAGRLFFAFSSCLVIS